MDWVEGLKAKGITVREIPNWGSYLRDEWISHFASHLNAQEKRDIYLKDGRRFCGYLWHVFSYETRAFLEEKEADRAFDEEQKWSCYVFFQDQDDAYLLENSQSLRAEDFPDGEDIYVVNKKFSWTYMKTHENGHLGPYFSRKE